MNIISKVFFWIFAIGLGFVNPLITVGLIVLYYLPGIIQSACNDCNSRDETFEYEQPTSQNMNDYSDDTLEEMK